MNLNKQDLIAFMIIEFAFQEPLSHFSVVFFMDAKDNLTWSELIETIQLKI